MSGEIDLATAKAFRFALIHALEPNGTIRIDLSDVSFIDSTGLAGLVAVSKEAQEVNTVVKVVAASEQVRAAITLSGLASRFLTS